MIYSKDFKLPDLSKDLKPAPVQGVAEPEPRPGRLAELAQREHVSQPEIVAAALRDLADRIAAGSVHPGTLRIECKNFRADFRAAAMPAVIEDYDLTLHYHVVTS